MLDTRDAGVGQNARLTGLTAAVLLVLLAAEGVTILRIEPWIGPHIVIGFVLVAPVALKLSSTGYKIVRYYTSAPAYVAEGPPPLSRRLLAPVVMVTTAGVLGTGFELALLGPDAAGRWTVLHKGFFVLWFLAMTVHVLLHLTGTGQAVVGEYTGAGPTALSGRGRRQLVLLGTLFVGVVLGYVALRYTGAWTSRR